jgi:hypothetical protein
VAHDAIHSLKEGCRRRKKLDTDEIVVVILRGVTEVPDTRVGNRRLPIQGQAHGLDGFNGERLVRFDQRAMVCEVVHANRIAGIE